MAYAPVNGLQLVLLDHLGITEADLFGFSLGGLVAYAVALGAPARVGKLIVASADAQRPPGRESAPLDQDRMPTQADFQAMRDAYDAVAPDPAHFDQFAARTSAMVHEFPGWTDELRSLHVPTMLIFGDRDFSPLPDVVEMFELPGCLRQRRERDRSLPRRGRIRGRRTARRRGARAPASGDRGASIGICLRIRATLRSCEGARPCP
jgi:alpha/beta hydrolase fold